MSPTDTTSASLDLKTLASDETDLPPASSVASSVVVLLIPYIMKHQEPQIREANQLIPKLKVLMSVWLEPQRDYKPDHQALDTTVQKTWTIKKKWKHESGFEDNLNVHFPYDTFFQLRRLKPSAVVPTNWEPAQSSPPFIDSFIDAPDWCWPYTYRSIPNDHGVAGEFSCESSY